MGNLSEITKETKKTQEDVYKTITESLKKDATSQGINSSSNLTGISLEAPAKVLIPAVTKFRNIVPREMDSIGALAKQYRAILSANTTGIPVATGLDAAGMVPTMAEKNFMSTYGLISEGVRVTRSAQMFGRGFDDVKAVATQNGLIDLLKNEDRELLGGSLFSLGTVSTPVAGTVAKTGGTIAAGTYSVACAARTLSGSVHGNSTAASSAVNFTAASGDTTDSVTVTVAAVPGACVYDWYVGSQGGTLYYYGTTTTNVITITSIPTAGATSTGLVDVIIPGSHTVNSDMSITFTPIDTAAKCNTDNSVPKDGNGNVMGFNGLIATCIGDYVNVGGWNAYTTHGTGAPSGAYYASLNGAAMTADKGTVYEIDAALEAIYGNTKDTPSKMMCNPALHKRISDLMVQSGNNQIFVQPNNRVGALTGMMNTAYLDKFTGQSVEIVDEPWMPDGTLVVMSETLPFPNSNITSTMKIWTQEEYNTFEYGVARQNGANGGPRYDADIRCIETFVNYFPPAFAVIQNIG